MAAVSAQLNVACAKRLTFFAAGSLRGAASLRSWLATWTPG